MIGLVTGKKRQLWGNGMFGGSRGQAAPSRGEGAIKIPQGENQTESAGRGVMPPLGLRVRL